MKRNSQFYYTHITSFAFILLCFLCCCPALTAQNAVEPDKAAIENGEDPNITRWKIFLDSVAQESRTAFPEERRVYPTVEAANAYWDFDPKASQDLYKSALDTAVYLTKQDKKYKPLIKHILSSAARRDPSLAKMLGKRLVDSDFKNADDVSDDAAMDLVESDPEAAARIAEAFAPHGLRDGSASDLIFRLARKDIRLSDRVYGTYLNSVARDPTVPLDLLLYLGGYSFGYTEFFTIDGRGNVGGGSFLPIKGLNANPAFTNAFLNLAYSRTAMAIERRNQATGEDIAALNFPILFAFEYLMPEVARFSPNSLTAWQQLQQQGMAGTTPAQVEQVRGHVQMIIQSRIRVKNYTDSSQTPERQAEDSLKDVEKLPGTCQRDVVYSEAAIVFSSRKNFKRALEINEKIEDLKQSESVNQLIRREMAESAIEKGDPDVRKMIEKITSPEHRAILLVTLATKTNDAQVAAEAIKLANKLSNAGDSAGILLSLSTAVLKTDPAEAQNVLSIGLKYLNKAEPTDQPIFLIPEKVSLSCNGEDKWYGGFATLPNATIFDAISVFAKRDPDSASRLADEIGDKITKLRAQAIIARIALADLEAKKRK